MALVPTPPPPEYLSPPELPHGPHSLDIPEERPATLLAHAARCPLRGLDAGRNRARTSTGWVRVHVCVCTCGYLLPLRANTPDSDGTVFTGGYQLARLAGECQSIHYRPSRRRGRHTTRAHGKHNTSHSNLKTFSLMATFKAPSNRQYQMGIGCAGIGQLE